MHFLGGIEMPYFWEPPLHEECAVYSLQVCPGITRRPGMGVHVCDEYELFDKFEYDPNDASQMEMVKTGTVPWHVQVGLTRAAFTYHGAKPIGGYRVAASAFLDQVRDG
jgi:hypothetical protein